jgi:hypothetical protein
VFRADKPRSAKSRNVCLSNADFGHTACYVLVSYIWKWCVYVVSQKKYLKLKFTSVSNNIEIIIHLSVAVYHFQCIQGSSVTSHALCVLHDNSLKVFYNHVISQQMHIYKQVQLHVIFFTSMFRSLLWPSSGSLITITLNIQITINDRTTWCYTWLCTALLVDVKCPIILSVNYSKIGCVYSVYWLCIVDSHHVR